MDIIRFIRSGYDTLRKLLKGEHAALLLVLLCAFAFRIYFLLLVRKDPAFLMPVVDSLEYQSWAEDILKGNFLWTQLTYHPPLYAYFLAALYKVFGYGTLKIALVQYAMAVAGIALLYLIAKRIVNRAVALLSSIFMATYWFFVYAQTFLFSENLAYILNILLVYLLVVWKDSVKKYLACGVLLGLSMVSRPGLMLLPFLLLAWFIARRLPARRVVQFFFVFFIGLVMVILPVAVRNYMISGEFVLLRTQVGCTLYLGNNPDFKGTSIRLEVGKDWEDFISMPSRVLGRQVKETEADVFFIKETIAVIKRAPVRWLKLIAGKFFSVLMGRDFLTSEDVYFYDKYIVASTPFAAVSTRLLCILAGAGVVLSFTFARRFLLLYVVILSEIFLLFFQIKSRYLIPVMPFVVIFSSYALYRLYGHLYRREWSWALGIVAMLCVLNTASFMNPLQVELPDASQTYYAIAKNYDARNMYDNAIAFYLRCLQRNPRNIAAYNDLGLLCMNLKRYDAALMYFDAALSIDPHSCKTIMNYKLCQELKEKAEKRNTD